jgi:flavoprotein
MGHIELSRSADLVVVAPATADLIAKAATAWPATWPPPPCWPPTSPC